uniref:Uncharacterized protein n=1 Tax=Rhizophagus irregularis (strain DAOM 181602 / DAOM 197198 / MUCL 43194) TaxID=747089 RepID=U9U4R1_RHIID
MELMIDDLPHYEARISIFKNVTKCNLHDKDIKKEFAKFVREIYTKIYIWLSRMKNSGINQDK